MADNLKGGKSIETEAPLTAVIEMLNREKSHETIVHFINFDYGNRLSPFRVELKKQFKGKVKSASLFSPESDQPVELEFREEGSKVVLEIPGMQLYSMLVVSH